MGKEGKERKERKAGKEGKEETHRMVLLLLRGTSGYRNKLIRVGREIGRVVWIIRGDGAVLILMLFEMSRR